MRRLIHFFGVFVLVGVMLLGAVGASADDAYRKYLSDKACGAPVQTAPGSPYPLPPPEDLFGGGPWRMLSSDQKLAVNTCVGDMTRPECVVDTMIACELWGETGRPKDDYGGPQRLNPVCKLIRPDINNIRNRMMPHRLGRNVYVPYVTVSYKLFPITITEKDEYNFCSHYDNRPKDHKDPPEDVYYIRPGDVAVFPIINEYWPQERCRINDLPGTAEKPAYSADCPMTDCRNVYPGWGWPSRRRWPNMGFNGEASPQVILLHDAGEKWTVIDTIPDNCGAGDGSTTFADDYYRDNLK